MQQAPVVVGHELFGDLDGDGFDEVARRAGDDIVGGLRDGAVIDGVRQIVAGGGGAEVQPQGDVAAEVLAVALLVVEDAVVAADPLTWLNTAARAWKVDG